MCARIRSNLCIETEQTNENHPFTNDTHVTARCQFVNLSTANEMSEKAVEYDKLISITFPSVDGACDSITVRCHNSIGAKLYMHIMCDDSQRDKSYLSFYLIKNQKRSTKFFFLHFFFLLFNFQFYDEIVSGDSVIVCGHMLCGQWSGKITNWHKKTC